MGGKRKIRGKGGKKGIPGGFRKQKGEKQAERMAIERENSDF